MLLFVSVQELTMSSESEFQQDEIEAKKMKSLMGFSQFDSSKGKDHSKSSAHAVMKVSKRKHRQFVKPSHKRLKI